MAVTVGWRGPMPELSLSHETAAPASQRVSEGAALLLHFIAPLAIGFRNV